ncbi:hypothetical protein RFI_08089, partial [Reticulomyxa filosa]
MEKSDQISILQFLLDECSFCFQVILAKRLLTTKRYRFDCFWDMTTSTKSTLNPFLKENLAADYTVDNGSNMKQSVRQFCMIKNIESNLQKLWTWYGACHQMLSLFLFPFEQCVIESEEKWSKKKQQELNFSSSQSQQQRQQENEQNVSPDKNVPVTPVWSLFSYFLFSKLLILSLGTLCYRSFGLFDKSRHMHEGVIDIAANDPLLFDNFGWLTNWDGEHFMRIMTVTRDYSITTRTYPFAQKHLLGNNYSMVVIGYEHERQYAYFPGMPLIIFIIFLWNNFTFFISSVLLYYLTKLTFANDHNM